MPQSSGTNHPGAQSGSKLVVSMQKRKKGAKSLGWKNKRIHPQNDKFPSEWEKC